VIILAATKGQRAPFQSIRDGAFHSNSRRSAVCASSKTRVDDLKDIEEARLFLKENHATTQSSDLHPSVAEFAESLTRADSLRRMSLIPAVVCPA
jgi:hypothetical protein